MKKEQIEREAHAEFMAECDRLGPVANAILLAMPASAGLASLAYCLGYTTLACLPVAGFAALVGYGYYLVCRVYLADKKCRDIEEAFEQLEQLEK